MCKRSALTSYPSPYVRHEGIKDQKPAIKIEFPTFFKGTADLYTYFYKRGIELLSPHAHLCFIAPNKFFKAGYGELLRTMLTHDVQLMRVLDFGELPVFDAGTDPSILLIEKSAPVHETTFAAIKRKEDLQDLVTSISKTAKAVPVADLSVKGWNFSTGNDRILLDKIEATGTPLGQFVEGRFYRGILTGLNEAFVIDAATRAKLIAEDPKCEEIIKPWLNGRDILRWFPDDHNVFLIHLPSSANKIYPWSNSQDKDAAEKIFAKTYPSIFSFFQEVDNNLKQKFPDKNKSIKTREDQGKFYWELRSCAYDSEFLKEKIVYNETSKNLHAFYDNDGFYVNKTGFIILSDKAKYLLGLMNSTLMDFYFRSTFPAWGDPWNGGRVQFRGDRMERIPIVNAPSKVEKLITDHVSRITTLKKQNPDADVSTIEQAIDAEVYKLYGLTTDEITIIEQATRNAHEKAA